MSLLDWGATESDTYRECRHCGRTVEDPVDACPVCGATAIAAYEL